MPPLSMMIKPVSSSCNMRCRYCFYADVSAHREVTNYGMMNQETMVQLIRRAFVYADNSISFSFQGGEPTLAGLGFFRSFVKTVQQYNSRNIPVSYALQTNGYALDDDFCAFLAEHRFLVGVSVDGTKDIHDALRRDTQGQGTYTKVMNTIRRLQKHGVEYNILCVVTAPAARRGAECWHSLSHHRYLQFIPCIDDFCGSMQEYSLNAEAYGQFLIDTFSCYEQAWRAGSPISERRFDNYLSILLGQQPEACGMCGVCGLYFLVESDGSVYPCDFYVLDEWRMGNVNSVSLQRIAKSENSQSFRETSRLLPDACHSCQWLSLCRGGCRRDREPSVLYKDYSNRFCDSYKMFFEACFTRLNNLAKQIYRTNIMKY